MRRLLAYIGTTTLLQPLSASPAADSTPLVHPEVEAWAIRAAASNGFGGDLVYKSAGRKRTDAAPHAASVDLSDPLASAVVRARRLARRALALLRLYRRRARERNALGQLQALDAAALRDLGLTRSEIGSVLAEAAGRAAATRRQTAQAELLRIRAGVPVGTSTSI